MGSLSPEVSIGFNRQKFNAILDYLMGCGRTQRPTCRVLELENSYISIMEDVVLDSAFIMDFSAVLNLPEDDSVNILKEEFDHVPPKFCPPRIGVSAIRIFPPGCGRGAPPIGFRDCSIYLRKNGLKTKNNQDLGTLNRNSAKLRAATISRSNLRKSKPKSRHFSRKWLEEPKHERMRKMTRNKGVSMGVETSEVSGCAKSAKGLLETGIEPRMKTTIVQALAAKPNCPWKQGNKMNKMKN